MVLDRLGTLERRVERVEIVLQQIRNDLQSVERHTRNENKDGVVRDLRNIRSKLTRMGF